MASALVAKRGGGGVIRGESTTVSTTILTISPSNNAQITITTNVPSSGGSYTTGITRLVILNWQISDSSYYRGGTTIEKIPDSIRTRMSYNPQTGRITAPTSINFMLNCSYEYVGW